MLLHVFKFIFCDQIYLCLVGVTLILFAWIFGVIIRLNVSLWFLFPWQRSFLPRSLRRLLFFVSIFHFIYPHIYLFGFDIVTLFCCGKHDPLALWCVLYNGLVTLVNKMVGIFLSSEYRKWKDMSFTVSCLCFCNIFGSMSIWYVNSCWSKYTMWIVILRKLCLITRKKWIHW